MLAIAAVATVSPSLRRPPPFPEDRLDRVVAEHAAPGPSAEGPIGGTAETFGEPAVGA
jgi:hypothetical protein